MLQTLMLRSAITFGLTALTTCSMMPNALADRPVPQSPAPQSLIDTSRGKITKISGQVTYFQQGHKPRNAKIGDSLFPMDRIVTGSKSRVEVHFHDGTIVRIGSKSIIRIKRQFTTYPPVQPIQPVHPIQSEATPHQANP
jgi:hypothetical protein